jgi:hypothetical protein
VVLVSIPWGRFNQPSWVDRRQKVSPSRAAAGKPLRSVYSATKAALHGMTRTMALELGQHGITVDAIGLGSIATDLFTRPKRPAVGRLVVHKIHAPALVYGRRHRRRPTMQTEALTPSDPHSHLQALEPVESVHALQIDRPSLAPQQHVSAAIAKPRAAQGDVGNAHSQRALISCCAAPVPTRPADPTQPTRSRRAHLEPFVDPSSDLSAPRRLQI